MKAPTKRQTEVLDFISRFLGNHKYPPTIREIAGNFDISVKAAYDHVKALEKKNLIACNTHRSRAIEIISPCNELAEPGVEVPILGQVAAGSPLLAEENVLGSILLPSAMMHRGDMFALRVEGDSMIGVGIMEGDLGIFVQQNVAENGQIIVAAVEEGYTLKRFYREKNRIRLQPENPEYSPLFTADVRILGRLVHLIRSY